MATPTTPSAALLLEVVTTRDPETATGIRIYADGRYEELSDTVIEIRPDGGSQVRRVPHAWRTAFTYTADELAEVRRLIAAADFPALQPRYPGAIAGRTPNTQTWRASLDGQVYEVVVEGYQQPKAPALATLYAGLGSVRRLPVSRSLWRVWVAGAIQERHVNCEVGEVSELRPLVQALFSPAAAGPGAEGAELDLPALPDGVPLVEVLWHEQGRPDERTLLFADGRLLSRVDGQEQLLRTLTPAQLAALIEAGAAIGWSELPDPVCG